MLTAALDYETFYSKEYSIRDMGNYAYTRHREFDPYMLTVAADDGNEWCGNPLDFNYGHVDGTIWLMANAGFDLSVTDALIEAGKISMVTPFAVYDVLDLARYLGFPGNLAGAAEAMLGIKLDKGTRDKAKGKHWSEMTPDFQREMSTYALRDAQVTLKIWQKYGHLWPEHERELSRLTREMCARGLPVDLPGINTDIKQLETLLWKTRTQIPWTADPDATVLSKKQVAIECRKSNVEPPKSMAKDSEEFDEWLRKYGDQFKWARAMGSYRSINGQLKRLRAMLARCKQNTDGTATMVYGLKYAGAHTLRDSGDAGVNVQNFSKKPMFEIELRELAGVSTETDEKGKFLVEPDKIFGIDMRGKIMAPPGFDLGVVDLSAIEPCVTATVAEDWNMVELLSKGMDPYEAWARVHHNYVSPLPLKGNDDKLRQLCKVEVLGLGYGAGAEKLIIIAKTLAGLTLSLSEATSIVTGFRKIPFIPALWNKLERGMRSCSGKDFTVQLPSGRNLLYRDVKNYGKLSAVIPRTGKMMRLTFWGGTLTENLVQAIARDVFMDRVLELDAQGIPSILRVHDEAVSLLNSEVAEQDLQTMTSVFSKAPAWFPELPVRGDGYLCKRYVKH